MARGSTCPSISLVSRKSYMIQFLELPQRPLQTFVDYNSIKELQQKIQLSKEVILNWNNNNDETDVEIKQLADWLNVTIA